MWQRTLAICKHVFPIGSARPTLYSVSTIERSGASLIGSTAGSTSIRQRWTPMEDQKLAELHVKGVAVKHMTVMFPGRSYAAVSARRAKLNLITLKAKAPHSQSEDETLMRLRSERKPWTTILSALPQRSRKGLGKRLTQLRKKDVSPEAWTTESPRRKWTDDEEQRLRDLVSQALPWREIVQLMPPRSLQGLQAAAKRMELPMPGRRDRWTTKEDEALIKGRAAGMTWESIHTTMLPGRTPLAIKNRWSGNLVYWNR